MISMKRLILAALAGLAVVARMSAQDTNAVLTLDQARRMAIEHHPNVAAANYRVAAAEEMYKETRAGELPQAALYGTAAGANYANDRVMAGGLNNPSVYERLAGGLGVSQLLTDFGRTANLKASSEYASVAEHQNATDIREQVWLRASTSYFGVLEAGAILKVANKTFQTRQVLLDQVTALATNKLKSQLDVGFARVSLEESRLLVQKAQNNLDASEAALSDALGLRNMRRYQLVEPPAPVADTNDVEDLIQTALARRPEILSLRAQAESARRFSLAERDIRRPTVSALGVIGAAPIRDRTLDQNYAAADLNVSVPLFTGGLYLARQHRAEAEAEAQEQVLRSVEDDVIEAVRVAALNVNNARQQLATTEVLVQNATDAFELAQARYQAQLSSMVELTQIQLSLVTAQIAEAGAHYDLLREQANLDYQTGVPQ